MRLDTTDKRAASRAGFWTRNGVVRDTDYRDANGAERAFRRVVLRETEV